jgi:hypothetical protein
MRDMHQFFHVAFVLLTFVDRFVITEQLPEVKRPGKPPIVTPIIDPVKACQCGCKRQNCRCREAGSFPCPNVPGESSVVEWNHEALEQFAAAGPSQPERTLTVFSPPWCPACKVLKNRLGDGDGITKLKWVKTEAHFVPKNGYPCIFDPVGLKQVSGSQFKSMDEVRRVLGIPATAKAVGAVNAGTLDKSLVESVIKLFRPGASSMTFGNEEIKYAGPVTFIIPKHVAASGSTTGGITKLLFNPKPKLQWGWINQSVDGVSYDGAKISVLLPFAPDVDFQVKDIASTPFTLESSDELGNILDVLETRRGYPMRAKNTWYTHPGPSTAANMVQHLSTGQHGHKFSPLWLQSLTVAELESLHSDDHDGRLKMDYVHGYRFLARERKIYDCRNGVCGWYPLGGD